MMDKTLFMVSSFSEYKHLLLLVIVVVAIVIQYNMFGALF